MKCPKCQFENEIDTKFCNECGTELGIICPECSRTNRVGSKFCKECGQSLLKKPASSEPHYSETEVPSPDLQADKSNDPYDIIDGERKHVTVLFTDLSGYTTMCERLDPEEVKEITSRIFGEITKIVAKYEGFIEKFIGDAAMAIFGATKTYEDDPVRAIRTAREIHLLVESLSPKYEKKIGQPLSMHSGINTGLVVTGEVNLRKGTHGISGDTINLAARLSSLGEPGDILVDPDTHNQAQGYFNFEDLGLTKVKGKTESVQVYKVITPKEQPHKVRRVHGLRAKLIGRKVEIAQLEEAVYKLKNGKVSIFSICGAAGTGKSRLVEEFKAMLDLEKIQWREGHAYSYAQNIPYFPLINLLSRAFQIEEGDSRKKVRSRVESGIKILAGKDADIIPYIGSLFDLSYPELEGMSPDSWKFNLHKAIQEILSALLLRAPTVICLEDLHWADPSSIELFRLILKKTKHPAIFLCTYRPVITLFSSHQFGILDKLYQEINLHDLSPSEMQEMLKSLLKTKNIPPDLRKFVQGMIEGNPFYLEEVINSLIESETLIRKNEDWVLSRPITKYRTPPTIQGVIAARLDHLGIETKRALQEASVIGRIFLYDILKRISVFKDRIDECLKGLELHDLIRTKSLQPELEYVFKHAMTQEVVYNGILKKERKAVHGQIGLVMEKLFYDRLSEFYEALAFHFERSQFAHKALDYLVKSGEKSIGRYALEESQQYFKQAFDLISEKPKKTKEEKKILVDLLIKWAFVFHLRGSYSDLTNLLKAHEDIAVSIDDKEKLGMFYAWLGLALQSREKLKDAHQYLHKALKIAEEINHYKVIGYANAWLAQTCADLGLLDDAIVFGKNAIETSRNFKSDQSLFSSSYRALGYAYWFRGECDNTKEVGNILLNYGQNQSDIRSITLGHMYIGMGHHIAGDFPHAIERYQRAIQLSEDPRFLNSAKLILGMSYISDGKHQEAENTLEEVMRFSEEYGSEYLGTAAQGLFGIVLLAKGNLKKGVKITEDVLKEFDEKGSRYRFAGLNFVLGNVYLQIVQKNEPKSISFIAKNIGFLMKNVPFASKKAEFHFKKTIEVAKEISSKSYLGRAYLSLGSLHKAKGRIDQARKYISRAVIVFEQCEADVFLKQAKEALKALG